MNSLLPRLVVFAACLPVALNAAEDTAKTNLTEAITAQIEREAKQGKVVAPPRTQAAADAARPTAPAPAEPVASSVSPASAAKAREESPTVLDPVEVRKRKMTEFEDQMKQQEAEIIREKKLTTPSELDKALNDSKIAKVLSIFGGESNSYRANIAQERVSMMEDEKDLIEAIAQAKTREEKQELRKQLNDLKKMRRELERALK